MQQQKFDVIIVGAGPAGSSCAIALAGSGLTVALVDKGIFPRDKICGDALSIDVVNQLAMLSSQLATDFASLENKIASYGVKIFSTKFDSVTIPVFYKGEKKCGYVSPRLAFDDFLFNHAKKISNIHCFENCAIDKIEQHAGAVIVYAGTLQLEAAIVIGADGAHSIVGKQLANTIVDKDHYSAGLRVYYDAVTGFEEGDHIELHFFKKVVPGYLWIFPLANNRANVGIGMLSSVVAKRKINLKETLQELLTVHPHLSKRFENAKPMETVKGFGLPLGSKKRNISGERFLLIGDAASLIDPFSGEGIGNAMRSGRIAAKHIQECFKTNDFSASFNKQYDREIYRKMWKEFRISRLLMKVTNYTWLCDLIVKKANSNAYINKLMMEGLASVDKRKSLFANPKFYYKLFFSGKLKEKHDHSAV